MRHLDGFAALGAAYDGFIVDLWGVIHDGLAPYDGAIDCLHRLRASGKRVVLLSNAPRRSARVRASLRHMGLPDDGYDAIMTSGEASRTALIERSDPWFAALGRRLLHIGPEKDRTLFEDLDFDLVTDPAQADFLLNTGPDDDGAADAATVHDAALRAAAGRRLPMLCANPDLEIVRGGKRILCAGYLARVYEQSGGSVRFIGKPYREVYDTVLPMLGAEPSRILAVGDALATDIAGAAAAGIASCWVLGGIHAEMIGTDHALAEAQARAAGLAPVATVPAFAW